MLTRDLVRVRLPRGGIVPSWIDPESADLRDAAEQLCDVFRAAAEERWTRAAIDESVDDVVGDRRNAKVVRGLAKLLLDRCAFEVDTPIPPVELREAVFRAAREAGGVSLEPGPLDHPVAEAILARVGEAHGLSSAEVRDALYADLPSEQRLASWDARDAAWLLHRYNVALVQAVLLHASEVRVTLEAPSVPRIRQLLRWAKFHELIHHAARVGDVLVLRLDGPTSLFKQSTRYGLQLARFFPALPLQDGPWSLEATIRWKRSTRTLSVDSTAGLRSHYRDTGAYETRTHQWFVERFEATDSPWRLDRRVSPIDLGGRGVILPDYRLRNGDRTAFVEIVGFWRRGWLERRIEALTRHGPGNLVLAVSRKLGCGDDLDGFDGAVVPFANVVPVKDILAEADRVAT